MDEGADEIERRVSMRMRRQKLFGSAVPPHLWAIIDEAALWRPVGGRATMRRQVEHLIELSSIHNVSIQVLPFRNGGHTGAGGTFSILRFAQPDLPDVAYVEQLTSALYLDQLSDVNRYQLVMDRLCTDAHPMDGTAAVLSQILKDL